MKTNDVYGVSNSLIATYIERPKVDKLFLEGLDKNKHIIVYGASKQGKTSLTNKHVPEESIIKVNCSPSASIIDLYKSIVRQCNIQVLEESEVTNTYGGDAQISLNTKVKIPIIADIDGSTDISGKMEKTSSDKYKTINYNLALAQDLSELLKDIGFNKRIILENFHYLNEDVQKQLSIDLRIFEDYNILFIILGIWREKNKLTQFNGDLLDRVIEIPVEPWEKDDLKKIVATGKPLLNVSFDHVVDYIIESCFDSVGVFQEICKSACKIIGVEETQENLTYIEKKDIDLAIKEKLSDYSSRHSRSLDAFVQQQAKSSEDIPLYMSYYFILVLLSEPFENITLGLRRKIIQDKIKEIHHRPEDIRASDMGYFVTSLVSSQIRKGISPPIFDYDNGTTLIKIIDSTFYFFLKNSNKEEIIENLNIPAGIE